LASTCLSTPCTRRARAVLTARTAGWDTGTLLASSVSLGLCLRLLARGARRVYSTCRRPFPASWRELQGDASQCVGPRHGLEVGSLDTRTPPHGYCTGRRGECCFTRLHARTPLQQTISTALCRGSGLPLVEENSGTEEHLCRLLRRPQAPPADRRYSIAVVPTLCCRATRSSPTGSPGRHFAPEPSEVPGGEAPGTSPGSGGEAPDTSPGSGAKREALENS